MSENRPMLKKIFFILFFCCSISYAQSPLRNYDFMIQNVPIICMERETMEKFTKDFDFVLQSRSLGRTNMLKTGAPVFLIEYFVNKSKTESLAIVTAPDAIESCILYRSFDLTK